jgi:hypothetical protein
MPPRFAYWTIIAGGLPTAFRAAEREELLPTFTRLKEKQPDAEMKWFARGKLWASPEEARASSERGRTGGPRADHRAHKEDAGRREVRGRDWRPGGEHRDSRQKFKDAKKDRNQRFKQEKFLRKFSASHDRRDGPHRDDEPRERRQPWDQRSKPDQRGQDERRQNWKAKPSPENRRGGAGWTPPHGDKLTRRTRPDSRNEGGAFRDQRRERPWPKSRHDDERPQGDKLTHPPRGAGHAKPRPWEGKGDRSAPRGDRGQQAYRGAGHGENSWKPKQGGSSGRDARPKPWESKSPNASGGGRRPFQPPFARTGDKRGHYRDRIRGGGTEEPTPPPRPPGPNREPRPGEEPKPSAPPRPREPGEPPTSPPERGRIKRNNKRSR